MSRYTSWLFWEKITNTVDKVQTVLVGILLVFFPRTATRSYIQRYC